MAAPKELSFGKLQIYLHFRSLNRTFAVMLKKYVILFYALLSSVGLFAQYEEWTTDSITVDTASVQPSWEEQLQCRLTALTQDALFETSQLGMMVYDLDADSALFVFNHRQAMRPASTMKVLTAVTALDLLGGDYTFQTRLCVDGDVEGRTLRGDVYCVGGLDPLFDDYDMQVFADMKTVSQEIRIQLSGIRIGLRSNMNTLLVVLIQLRAVLTSL